MTADGECHEPLSQGACDEGHWLVTSDSDILDCVKKQCDEEEVIIDGECQNIFNESICSGSGEAIFLNMRGEPSCQCKDGWGRKERDDDTENLIFWGKQPESVHKTSVKSGGRCYQEFTQGFCSGNMIVKSIDDNFHGCINNPCGNIKENIPH